MVRTRRHVLVPIVAALVGTFIYHRYSLLTGLDRVEADAGDSRFVAFLLEHWRNALHRQVDWRSPPIFWPVQGTIAYSELLVAMGFVHDALRSVLAPFAAINAQLVLLSLATFGTGYALLASGFGLSVWGATAGAYFFAFSWPRFAQLVHIQLQFTPLWPLLALLALQCLRDGRELGRLAFAWRAGALSVLLALLLATTLYFAIFFALALTVCLLLLLLHGPGRRHLVATVRRQAAGVVAAAALLAALVWPIAAVFRPVLDDSGGRRWTEVASFLPTNLLWMGTDSLVWGWWFARWPTAIVTARWPELRIGVGLVVTLAWVGMAVWAVAQLRRWDRLDRRTGPVVVTLLAGAILQVVMWRLPNGWSPWWLVWRGFPGASAIRAVPRLELLVTLPIGLALGVLLDAAIRAARGRTPLLAGVAAVALLAAVEQVGRVATYSGREAEALSQHVADAIPAGCTAALVVAPPDMQVAAKPVMAEADFDAAAYLASNPDVAANWKASAWDHYDKLGRNENRFLDPATAARHMATMFGAYNYTIPLAAALRGIPVVNGLSGWQPPGWDLFDVLSPRTADHLAAWLRITGEPASAVCTVPVRITLEDLPQTPTTLMP